MATKANSITAADLLVSETDVVASPRGRKATTDPVLVEAFTALTPGQALNLAPVLGTTMDKGERQKIGTIIRRNWDASGRQDACRIDFHPETGAPQVRIREPKA